MANKTFIRITNQQIYDKLQAIEENQREKFKNLEEHVIKTNGKVRTSLWVGTTAMSIALLVIVLLIEHVVK